MKNKKIISQIAKIRSINNKNWMDLLRISMKYCPIETKKVLRRINTADRKISDLVYKLGK
jgi:hypothetical protein